LHNSPASWAMYGSDCDMTRLELTPVNFSADALPLLKRSAPPARITARAKKILYSG